MHSKSKRLFDICRRLADEQTLFKICLPDVNRRSNSLVLSGIGLFDSGFFGIDSDSWFWNRKESIPQLLFFLTVLPFHTVTNFLLRAWQSDRCESSCPSY